MRVAPATDAPIYWLAQDLNSAVMVGSEIGSVPQAVGHGAARARTTYNLHLVPRRPAHGTPVIAT
jgi:hypothetical protein